MKLLAAIIESFAISRVHDPDERVGLLEVVLPVCAQSLLAADIPLVKSALVGLGHGSGQTYVKFISTSH